MEKNSTFLKHKKIILIDKTNFESSIALILREPDIDYLIFLIFRNNIEENLELLKDTFLILLKVNIYLIQ